MPTLSPQAKEVYTRSYGQETYNKYNDHNGTTHGGHDSAHSTPPAFVHRPDHDVESIFWVLLTLLLRAQPKEVDPVDRVDLTFYKKVSQVLDSHIIGENAACDGREVVLFYTQARFKQALDPKLGCLAGMLSLMARQVMPEYAHLQPPPHPDHLHEAMRRILLEQILKMVESGEAIPLIPGCSREAFHDFEEELEDDQSKLSAFTKRKHTLQDDRSTGIKKAKTSGHSGLNTEKKSQYYE
ncbi:hypothetical protein NLI96_g10860 [Meripilus lineatus]|uniref:Uncharacterized protein n=1 Tax=Meripilus lineatus TaxID=2056292 RepID=A0AAD5UUG7_9APHY|nr:hypothetical protein NLI96_g10860 [Physisporinus lineatus]